MNTWTVLLTLFAIDSLSILSPGPAPSWSRRPRRSTAAAMR